MRLIILLAGVLAASPALPASILYATAASEKRVDGFCLRGDGSLAPTPAVSTDTAGEEPRRLLVGEFPQENGETLRVLYVAQRDHLQAFRIGARGGLGDAIWTVHDLDVDLRDLELSADKTRLYVVQRGRSRVVAYALDPTTGVPPLDANGRPAKDFTSCIQGVNQAGYHEIELSRSLIYITADGTDRIDIHKIDEADTPPLDPGEKCQCAASNLDDDPELEKTQTCKGDLPACPDACTPEGSTRDPETRPLSRRLRVDNPKAFAIDGDLLYVEERGRRQISAFRLQPDGTFCDNFNLSNPDDAENPINVIEGCETTPPTDLCTTWCTGFDQQPTTRCEKRNADLSKKKPEKRVLAQKIQHCPTSTTGDGVQYQGLILHRGAEGKALLGSQFFRGRIDAFLLRPDGSLPHRATGTTAADLRMSPVGLAARDNENVLYVAAGEHDRVVAYRLNRQGLVADNAGPFSQTNEDKDSFPNDIAIATVEGCE